MSIMDWVFLVGIIIVYLSFSSNAPFIVERELLKQNPNHKIDPIVRFMGWVRLVVGAGCLVYILVRCSGGFKS